MVLLADEAARGEVQPIYVSIGLAWEAAERAMVVAVAGARAARRPRRPLVSLGVDMRDVYAATHWAMQGQPPAYHTPDEDVYLPGRNIVLLGKAACTAPRRHRSPPHRHARAQPVSRRDAGIPRRHGRRAVARPRRTGLPIDAPYAGIEQGRRHPRGDALGVRFELTLSCMNPGSGHRRIAESPVESRIPNTAPLRSAAASAASGTTRSSSGRRRSHASTRISGMFARRRLPRSPPRVAR